MARDRRLAGRSESGRPPVSARIVPIHYHLRLVLRLSDRQRGVHVQVLGPGVISAELETLAEPAIDLELERVVTAVA